MRVREGKGITGRVRVRESVSEWVRSRKTGSLLFPQNELQNSVRSR